MSTDNVEVKGQRTAFASYSGQAQVKAVLSGDTVILMGGVGPGALPKEKVLILSGINAPQLSRSKSKPDQPFGWEAREVLRRKCIGQKVFFTVVYETGKEQDSRAFGSMRLLNGDVDLAAFMVSAGFATVKLGKDGRIPQEREPYAQMQTAAINMALGIHNKNASPTEHTRNVNWFANHRALLDGNRNVQIPAIVDKVREGNVVTLELLGKGLQHTMLTMHLAGITCPRTAMPYRVLLHNWEKDKEADPSLPKPKPHKSEYGADEAQFFTAARLLHRNVKVSLVAVDKPGNIFGSLTFPEGNITEKLVEFGLASVVNWSANLVGNQKTLKNLETSAKQLGRGIWQKNNPVADPSLELLPPFQGKVVSVPSGDMLEVEIPTSAVPMRIYLASVRAPRMNNRDKGNSEFLALDAREFLRKKCIGKLVSVIHEYTQTGRDADESKNTARRIFATVTLANNDLGQSLLEYGLASVVRHRVDEDRSQRYDILLRVEDKAITEQRGIHSPAQSQSNKVVDLSVRQRRKFNKDDGEDTKQEDPAPSKARGYLTSLKRGAHDGVVEYISSGSRMKVYLPQKKLIIMLILGNIRTPTKDGKDKSDVLVNEEAAETALAFVSSRIKEQNVKVEVTGIDKGDNFIGAVYHNNENITTLLLQQGLAKMVGRQQDNKDVREQTAVEQAAKAGKLGIWKDWVEPVAVDNDEESGPSTLGEFKDGEEFVNLEITEVLDGVSFYATVAGDKNVAFVQEQMAAFSEAQGNEEQGEVVEPVDPKKGKLCAGLFEDGSWYRVQIGRRVDKEGTTFEAFFIDFGNRGHLSLDKLRELPESLAKRPASAKFCVLSACNAPKGKSQYAEGSTQALGTIVFGKTIRSRVDANDYDRVHVTLIDADSKENKSVNTQLLEQGFIRVLDKPSRSVKPELVAQLRESEDVARRAFVGIWEYGNVSDEEDEDPRGNDGRVPRKKH